MNRLGRYVRELGIGLLVCLSLLSGVRAETVSVPLRKLTALPAIELRCINGQQSIDVPVPERWDVKSATLTLRYTVSNNLIGEVSQLAVRLNGETVAQTKLNPQAPNVEVAIALPLHLLKSGYNRLSFHVAQHYSRQDCEPPCAPDLWTIISVTDSRLDFNYSLRPVPLKLGAATAMIFDPTQFPETHVHVVTEALTPTTATLATVVASGIARRFDYRKVKFTVSRTIMPGVDNVLIGSREFAHKALAANSVTLASGVGGLLQVLHVPLAGGGWDRQHALLVIADDRQATLRITAETLANMSLPYPDVDQLRAVEFSMPDVSMYGGRNVLASDKAYTFKTLDLPTHSFEGINAPPKTLSFRLPADFLIKQNQYAKLTINFSYSAGLRNNSALNVSVNGKNLRSIHLDLVSGAFVDGYKIDIPTYVFQPGANTISFVPALNIPGDACTPLTDGMFLTMYENSTLYIPPMPHFVELPKVELFALNGFPFTRWPDGFETMVYLPEANDASLAAAMNVVGMISQRNGFPLFSTQVVFDDPKQWLGELLVIGKIGVIPNNYMAAGPLNLGELTRVPYPSVGSWNAETAFSYSTQKSVLGGAMGIVMEFESIYKLGRSIILITAKDDEALGTLSDALLDPGVQAGIMGDLVFIDLSQPSYPVTSLSVGKRYTTGNKSKVSAVDSFLYTNPFVFYGVLAFAILALAVLAYWGLRRFRERRVAAPARSSGRTDH